MRETPFRVNPAAVTILAVALLAWAAVLIVIAVLGRHQIVPPIFNELRIEHFLAFYAIAFLAAAGLPTLKLSDLYGLLILLAFIVGGARWALWHDWDIVSADLICNVAGVLGALAPIHLARHRKAFFRGDI